MGNQADTVTLLHDAKVRTFSGHIGHVVATEYDAWNGRYYLVRIHAQGACNPADDYAYWYTQSDLTAI